MMNAGCGRGTLTTVPAAAAAAYVWLYSINAGQIASAVLTFHIDAAFDRASAATAIQFRELYSHFSQYARLSINAKSKSGKKHGRLSTNQFLK